MAKGIKKVQEKKGVPKIKKQVKPVKTQVLDYTKIKGVFVGSGSDGMQEVEVRD